jgi:acetyl esterase/lipase
MNGRLILLLTAGGVLVSAAGFILPSFMTPSLMDKVDRMLEEAPEPGGTVLKDIVFRRRFPGRDLLLDIYQPFETPPAAGAPTIVFFHGGSWLQGDKEMIRIIHRFLDKLRREGYAVVAVNYTDSIIKGLAGPVENSMAALLWLRDKGRSFGLDPTRLGLYGVSSGAHLVLMNLPRAMADPGLGVKFVLVEYGPTDLVAMAAGEAFEYSPSLRLFPRRILEKYSPLRYVASDWPPVLIFHGDADRIVHIAQSERLAEALRRKGVPVDFRVIPGGDHAFFNKSQEEWAGMEDHCLEFIRPLL